MPPCASGVGRILSLSLLLAVACDRFGEQTPTGSAEAEPAAGGVEAKIEPEAGDAKVDEAKAEDAKIADGKPSSPEVAEPAAPPVDDAKAVPAPEDPAVPALLSDDDRLEALAAKATAEGDASKTAWTHLKAKRYTEAQAYFARATRIERGPWKHPFNLACASSLAGDPDMARIALIEAMARDAAAVEAKARRDADLAAVRTEPWFEPVLRGERPPAVAPPPAAAPADAPPTEPTTAPDPPEDPEHGDTGEVREPPAPPEPSGRNVPLSKAQQDQLRDALTTKHGLKPAVKASLAVTPASGDALGWAVYEYGQYDKCLLTSAKNECRERLQGDPEEGLANDMKCTEAWLVRATFGATVSLGEPERLKMPCAIGKVRSLFASDVDGDGADEVIVDVVGQRELEGFREGGETHGGRMVRILRLDGTKQDEVDTAWTLIELAPGTETARRYGFRDANGDGHPDLEVQTAKFIGQEGNRFDAQLWPSFDDEVIEEVTVEVRLYDPSKDVWVASK